MTLPNPEDVIDPATVFATMLVSYSEEFDTRCDERHALGAEKYGPGKFLTTDTIEEGLQEIIDLANYARYTFIKLRMLQDALAAILPEDVETSDFIKAKSFTAVKEN